MCLLPLTSEEAFLGRVVGQRMRVIVVKVQEIKFEFSALTLKKKKLSVPCMPVPLTPSC